jgi:general secretion pathway protein A
MYERHFGFREDPFGPAADPKFLYFSREHAEALAALHYGLLERRGLLVLTGRAGMGKTTLLHHLAERWKDKAEVAFVAQPPEFREEMMRVLLEDLGVEAADSYRENWSRLRDRAAEWRRRGRRVLLIFDEAQAIPRDVLEEIRRLTNLETPEAKLLEVILAGQPGLEQQWTGEEGESLRQRVEIWAQVRNLDPAEVRRYVDHRIQKAGRPRGRVFTAGAIAAVAERSAGVPREINRICFQALSAAYARGKKRVGVAEVTGREGSRTGLRWAAAAAAALATGLVGAGYRGKAGSTDPVAAVAEAAAAAPGPPAARPLEFSGTARTVTVQRGQTMRRIALRTYGRWDPAVWEHVRRHNPGLTDPGKLHAGQILLLPPESQQ